MPPLWKENLCVYGAAGDGKRLVSRKVWPKMYTAVRVAGIQRKKIVPSTAYTEEEVALLLWVAVVVSEVLAEAAVAALGEVEAPGVAVRSVVSENTIIRVILYKRSRKTLCDRLCFHILLLFQIVVGKYIPYLLGSNPSIDLPADHDHRSQSAAPTQRKQSKENKPSGVVSPTFISN